MRRIRIVVLLSLFLIGAVPSKRRITLHNVLVTAYTPGKESCGKWADGKTATGKSAYTPGVAVCPSAIPYGSRVKIGDKWYTADDRCGAACKLWRRHHEYQIDLRVYGKNAFSRARKWGRRRMDVVCELAR